MDYLSLIDGRPITLAELLEARDSRAALQKNLLHDFSLPLLSFTLNIAGPVKHFSLAERAFEEGIRLITYQCKAFSLPIRKIRRRDQNAGSECFFVIDAPALAIKKAMCLLEEQFPLGRLFDLDVLAADGSKISRESLGFSPRRCLLCENSAFACGRSRAHALADVQAETCRILWEYFADQYAFMVASDAVKGLLAEVDATPKPGLVDRRNNGSHRDMSRTLFQQSALALFPYLRQCAQYGTRRAETNRSDFLRDLRPMGLRAELAMLRATGGVNTHKGAIFSMGILCAALGSLYGQNIPYSRDALRAACREIASPLSQDFTAISAKTAITPGEHFFVQYGVRGARGEAADGFPILFTTALPSLCSYRAQGFSENDAGVLALIHILAVSEDTNIITRSSYDRLIALREECRELLALPLAQRDYNTLAAELDDRLISENISPGGSADCLAAAYFIYFFEQRNGGSSAENI